MSKKRHIVVPRGWTAADVEQQFTDGRSRARFRHLTGSEAALLPAAGRIERLGESGKVWQLCDDEFSADASRPTGAGRISLEIPAALRSFVAAEMRGRPSWSVTIDP